MRARNIKPGTFQNPRLARMKPLARLVFIATWLDADREGRMHDKPEAFALKYFGWDEPGDIISAFCDLAEAGFLTRYVVGHEAFIQIINFSRHQHPHHRESPSIIPPPSDGIERDYDGAAKIIRRTLSTGQKNGVEKPQASPGLALGLPQASPGLARLDSLDSLDSRAFDFSSKNLMSISKPEMDAEAVESKSTARRPTGVRRRSDDRPATTPPTPTPRDAESATPTPADVVQIFNDTLGGVLPKVAKLNEARRAQVVARIRDDLPTVRGWRRYFKHVAGIPFLIGDNAQQNGTGHKWRASFDWLIKAGNYLKVLEGNYDP